MLKKLQNLLFEEDDDMDDEEIEDMPVEKKEVKPVVQPKVETPVTPQPVVEPKQEPSLKRIDVTQPIPVRPVQDAPTPSFDSLFSEPEEKKEEKQPKLGIVLDEKPVVKKPEQPKVAKPTKPQQAKTKPTPTVKSGYEFKPVISPIFGVDEKDLNAVKNTARKYAAPEKIKADTNISPIISPIYGQDEDEVTETPRVSTKPESPVSLQPRLQPDDDIPEFSLDDILLVRDSEEKPKDTAATSELKSLFERDDDETTVLDKRKFPSEKGLK